MLSIFCAPSRYVQGRNATKQLGAEIKKLGLGETVLIIAGVKARKYLRNAWDESLGAEGITYDVMEFGGECSFEEIERGKQRAINLKATTIIGAGGGKVLDTARAVASELNLPVVNCPTTASSDAPCSALSVVYTPKGTFEKYLFYKRNPDLVLVDTSVICMAPARLLVSGMGDALATWFEAKTVTEARKKNQVGGATTLSALALAELCYKTLVSDGPAAVHAVKTQTVTPALERIVEANTLLSGLGFESGGLAVAHSVHNGLTVVNETHNFLHGEKVAFGVLVQLVLEGVQSSVLDEVMRFSSEVGLPLTLSDVGLKGIPEKADQNIIRIAQRATAEGETAHNEPFEVTPELVVDAILAADAIATEFKTKNAKSNKVAVGSR